MTNLERFIFAMKVTVSLNRKTEGKWNLGINVKESTDAMSVNFSHTNNEGLRTEFTMLVGDIHAVDGESMDIIYNYGEYSDIIAVSHIDNSKFEKIDMNDLIEQLKWFFESLDKTA